MIRNAAPTSSKGAAEIAAAGSRGGIHIFRVADEQGNDGSERHERQTISDAP